MQDDLTSAIGRKIVGIESDKARAHITLENGYVIEIEWDYDQIVYQLKKPLDND